MCNNNKECKCITKCNNCKCNNNNKATISSEDKRRYMVIVDLDYNQENLEVWDYNLKKEHIDERVKAAKKWYKQDLVDIHICEHTNF